MSKLSHFFSDMPEKSYAAQVNRSKRLETGQFFTPYSIARSMARWVYANSDPVRILDPALGLGIFHRAGLEISGTRSTRPIGYEIDESAVAETRNLFSTAGYAQPEIHFQDFLASSWNETFDAVLCNPPYRKFRGRVGSSMLVESIRNNTGLTLSRAANLYVYFLVKAVWQLAEGGRAAFILPYEFLNADYGKPVKQYLLEHGWMRHILLFSDDFQPFDQVITTTCILLLERSLFSDAPTFTMVHSVAQLDQRINDLVKGSISENLPIPRDSFPNPAEKWHVPQITSNPGEIHGLVPLSTFGRVMRGIATGDNHYFIINERKRQEVGFGQELVERCLAKSNFAGSPAFSSVDFDRLVQAGNPVWLVNMQGHEEDAAVKEYLLAGIARGTSDRYLPKMRKPWYAIENRPAAPLLVTTFHRGQLRWVRNLADVRNLTAFHGFYPHPETDLDLLGAYLVTPLAQRVLAQNCRAYGNGLHKFEPNDLNHGLVFDVRELTESDQQSIREIYQEIIHSDQTVRSEDAISHLDRFFQEKLDVL